MNLGDRIKRYEAVTHHTATGRTPLMIRVDGKAFHSFTRGMARPFDKNLMASMVASAIEVAKEIQGFKAAYVQSDEVTFCLTDYDRVESQGWFDYDLSKVISLSASMMTANFNRIMQTDKLAMFDSRAFSIPANDVVNAFLWRAKDWERNSLQMYARANFSHKELQGKKRADMHEMLHQKNMNWATDLTGQEKNGTFIVRTDEGIIERHDVLPTYESIDNAIGDLF